MNQSSFFDITNNEARAKVAPLAVRMRPRTLTEFVGQEDIVGEGTWLRRVIAADALSSILLFGPAGTGKTTLARIIAASTQAYFDEVSAIGGTVADLRKSLEAAQNRLAIEGQRTILFIDEIHRFSKSQQDALLHAVEDRIVVLIGATTENPYFEVISALNSRSRIIELTLLSDDEVRVVIERALVDERGLADQYAVSDEVVDAIAHMAGGDARVALTTLELASQLSGMQEEVSQDDKKIITLEMVADAMPSKQVPYDKGGDYHYDIISAFIKSLRGSDPDAAVYWMARMLHGGEDPKFIARRMMIFASEDIGNADPRALLIAEAAFRSAEIIGMPECRIIMCQAATYLSIAPKSNAAIMAIDAALATVRDGSDHGVPSHLRDRHRPGSEGYGKYKYPHSYPGAKVAQQYLPDALEGTKFYQPSDRGWEGQHAT
ncbi:MAG: replication-associated recombination protein A [Actinomycetia bacterium]|nr:replication-associated recombination protein A [Actinomycetes bacterium]